MGHRRCVGTSRRPTARRRGILRHALEQLVEARSPQRAALVLTAERMPAHRHWQAPGTSILRPRWMRAWGVFSSLRLGGLFARVSPGSRSLGAAGWARRLAEPATECDWRPGLPGALTAGWARVAGLQAGQMRLGSHRAVRHSGCGRGGSDPRTRTPRLAACPLSSGTVRAHYPAKFWTTRMRVTRQPMLHPGPRRV